MIYSLFLLILFTIQGIISKIIFEDQFNELDSSKWRIINRKSDCANILPEKYSGCSTSNLVNLRTISGTLVITARRENYFNAKYTTATIVSQDSIIFAQNRSKLYFKIRASLPNIPGLIPRVDISPLGSTTNMANINLVNFNGTLWYGMIDKNQLENRTGHFDASSFNEYEMVYEQGTFMWLLNDNEIIKIGPSSLFVDKFIPYKIIITVEIDTKIISQTNYLNNLCRSFIIDYLRVEQGEKPEELKLNSTAYSSQQFCSSLIRLESSSQGYFKFNQENYTRLVFQDEFDGNKINESNWTIRDRNKYSENEINYTSCENGGPGNIEVGEGLLKLFLRKEHNNSECEFTGVRMVTKMCFNHGRIEIRAKLPTENNLVYVLLMETYETSCNQGNFLSSGPLFIKDPLCKYCMNVGMQVSESNYIFRTIKFTEDSFDYHVYGFEWTTTSIQWFIDERVVYQANHNFDQDGEAVSSDYKRTPLPFDHPFSLSLRIFLEDEKGPSLIEFSNWKENYLTVDYVRVYGEEPSSIKTETIEETTGVPYVLIICLNMVILAVIVIVIIMVYLRRKRRSQNELEQNKRNDGIELQDERYEDMRDYERNIHYDLVDYSDRYAIGENHNQDYLRIVHDHYLKIEHDNADENEIEMNAHDVAEVV